MKRFTFIIVLLSLFQNSNAQTVQTFITSGSFTVPAGVTSIFVEAWGGGGSGGGAKGDNSPAVRAVGGGGGGGAYNSGSIAVTPGDIISYTVATASATATTTPIDGGSSTFATITAVGGAGGECIDAEALGVSAGGLGGDGGVGQFNGGNGGDRDGYDGTNGTPWTSGPGGGGAGSSSSGGNAADGVGPGNQAGGTGGTGGGGAGGAGRTSSGNAGTAGLVVGGGGSGAWAAASTTQRAGGAGARGQIRITYSVLPVELTSFYVKPDRNDYTISLVWQTASEINNSHFSIERSTDGQSYREIGTVEGKGTSTSFNDYSFSDKTPIPGLNYYRLKQLDFDGNFEYSKVVSVRFGEAEGQAMLYPTLATNEVQLRFPAAKEAEGTVLVYEQSGKLLKIIAFDTDTTELPIATDELSSGHYFVKLQTGQFVQTLRFVKQ